MNREIQSEELERLTRQRELEETRGQEQVKEIRGETFRNSQFLGRRKRNVSNDGDEPSSTDIICPTMETTAKMTSWNIPHTTRRTTTKATTTPTITTKATTQPELKTTAVHLTTGTELTDS